MIKDNLTNDIEIGDKLVYNCPAPAQKVTSVYRIKEGPGEFTNDWCNRLQFKFESLYPWRKEITCFIMI